MVLSLYCLQAVNDDLQLDQFDVFRWDRLPNPPTTDNDSGNVSFSPDLMPGLLRSTMTGGIDSPIELEFDYNKAVLGDY